MNLKDLVVTTLFGLLLAALDHVGLTGLSGLSELLP